MFKGKLKEALDFATEAHQNQKRKYSGDPYITHPIAVAKIVSKYGGSQAQVAAALLHDVVEDTPVKIEDIQSRFGDEVAHLVDRLTDVSKPEDGNRAKRKALDRQHIAESNRDAQFIKAADIIHNTTDIKSNDPAFWVVYKSEIVALLQVMDKVKDTSIYRKAVENVSSQ